MKRIKGVIKNYNWGGYTYLPELLGIVNKEEPFGEYWLGTHPAGTATVEDLDVSLSEHLGQPLPFLMKILDVRDMLSIQLHPSKREAEIGFEKEEALGVAKDAYDRVFKDDNHKPELMVALSEFWLVQGFKSLTEIAETLNTTVEFNSLVRIFNDGGLPALYDHIMTMPQSEVNDILKPLGARIKPLYQTEKLDKTDIDFWAARAYFTFNRKGVCDRGILSLYLMNLVKLDPGQGMYQEPGVLHAYMEGQNIECMAASDNVVRGGLTSKHIDTAQLLKMVVLESNTPKIIHAQESADGVSTYVTPAKEFRLSRIKGPGHFTIDTPALALNIGDDIGVRESKTENVLSRGEVVLIEGVGKLELLTDGELFIAD